MLNIDLTKINENNIERLTEDCVHVSVFDRIGELNAHFL